EIEILSGGPGDTAFNSFHWSEFEKKLYAIRPVTARLKWFTSFTDVSGSGTNVIVNTDRKIVEGISVWPKDPIVHVAETPVQAEPEGVPFNYTFQSILFDATAGGAQFEPTSKTFNSSRSGYS